MLTRCKERYLHNLRNQVYIFFFLSELIIILIIAFKTFQVSHELQKKEKFKSGDGADDRYDSKYKFFSAFQFIVPCFTPTKLRQT